MKKNLFWLLRPRVPKSLLPLCYWLQREWESGSRAPIRNIAHVTRLCSLIYPLLTEFCEQGLVKKYELVKPCWKVWRKAAISSEQSAYLPEQAACWGHSSRATGRGLAGYNWYGFAIEETVSLYNIMEDRLHRPVLMWVKLEWEEYRGERGTSRNQYHLTPVFCFQYAHPHLDASGSVFLCLNFNSPCRCLPRVLNPRVFHLTWPVAETNGRGMVFPPHLHLSVLP